MLDGHAYSRAVRGHTLIFTALCRKIFNEINFLEKDIEQFRGLLNNCNEGIESYSELNNKNDFLSNVSKEFFAAMDQIEKRGKTARLWIQYIKLVAIAKGFMRTEKMGRFKEQLDLIRQMIPYIFAAGHFSYTKSTYIYIQKTQKFIDDSERLMALNESIVLPDNEIQKCKQLENFLYGGYNTVRRIDKFWCGNPTDMTIEQDLMRIMKIEGVSLIVELLKVLQTGGS